MPNFKKMTRITEIELKKLLDKFDSNPENLDLINQIAIGFFENPSMLKDNEDLRYFELAYSTKKTIKSTHNLAWYLYFEWGEQDRAIKIQKESIKLNPSSFFPYYLLGYMLLDQEQNNEAIQYLLIADQKKKRQDIIHNIGFCYFHLDMIEEAKHYFKLAAKEHDFEYRSLYNLALIEFKLGKVEETKKIAEVLERTIEAKVHKTISGYEIGFLYFLLDDFYKASQCLEKQGINSIDLADWNELSYSLFLTNRKKWEDQLIKGNEEREEWISEINNDDEDWVFESDEEKQERLSEINAEIMEREKLLKLGISKPEVNLKESFHLEHCGCLLFDCKQHGNISDDE